MKLRANNDISQDRMPEKRKILKERVEWNGAKTSLYDFLFVNDRKARGGV